MAAALDALVPLCPAYDRDEIAGHARTAPGLGKAAPETAVWLSLVAHIRHVYTDYEDLLADGYGIEAARHFCRATINRVLTDWGCRRQVSGEEPDEE
jgi:hypothetical protein